MFQSIKLNGKKIVVSTVVASSLFILPNVFTHKTFAAYDSVSTTHEVLNVGQVNNDVKALQSKLKSLNYYHYSIDGIYGVHTQAAVRNYQSDHHLIIDGVAGPSTLGSLFSSGTSSTTNVTASSSSILKVGSKGTAVKTVQTKLKNLGYLYGSVDGIFGNVTKQAVVDFQKNNSLVADGIVGPNTQAALNNNPKPASTTSTNPVQTSRGDASSTPVASIIKDAIALEGTPYLYGGTTPSGFDCSGFTQYVFAENGVSIPRTSSQQWVQGQSVSSPQVGDLVFFTTNGIGTVSHVGIYIGNNEFISSTSSSGVSVASLSNSYWGPRYLGAKRY